MLSLNAVTALFTSEQVQQFGFAEKSPAALSQNEVTDLANKQLRLQTSRSF